MKFVCDSCSTKYSIADERVKGRVLKIRCKTCNHVITVREDMAQPRVAVELKRAPNQQHTIGIPLLDGAEDHTVVGGVPGMSSMGPDPDEWYVSFDGDQEGPIALARALERVRAEVQRGKEAHAWRPGFFVWLPVEEVPEFAPALAQARGPALPQKPVPRPALRATGARAVVSPETLAQEAAARAATGPRPSTPSPAVSASASLSSSPSPLPSMDGPRPPTPSVEARKSNTGSRPAIRKDPTGPRAALSAVAPSASAPTTDLPPIDSKPMALPPPPTPLVPLAPDVIAPPPGRDPSVPITVEAQLTRPEKKAVLDKAHPPPSPSPSPSDDVSPFRAALAQGQPAGAPLAIPDSGPVPLPPPPVDDKLPIDEPSPLHSLKMPTPSPLPVRQTIETFGGASVTPSSSNGAAPAPVVVVAGPVHRTPPWMKWAALGGLVGSLGLGAVVIVLLTRHPAPPPVTTPPVAAIANPPPPVDKPITIADPPPPVPVPAPAPTPDPKRPAAATKRAPVAAKKNDQTLSSAQKNLASLYNDQNDHTTAHPVPSVDHSSHSSGASASQAAILGVVTQNRRALNLCYDRVLKHDSSLKRARLMTHVKVGLSGTVLNVTVPDPQFAGSEIATCITQSIKKWHFPAADGEYETEFPIILQAE